MPGKRRRGANQQTGNGNDNNHGEDASHIVSPDKAEDEQQQHSDEITPPVAAAVVAASAVAAEAKVEEIAADRDGYVAQAALEEQQQNNNNRDDDEEEEAARKQKQIAEEERRAAEAKRKDAEEKLRQQQQQQQQEQKKDEYSSPTSSSVAALSPVVPVAPAPSAAAATTTTTQTVSAAENSEATSTESSQSVSSPSFFSQLRSDVYDRLIIAMTTRWYRSFLCRLPQNSRVLDVGIGTATALVANSDILLQRNITVVGVDYDGDYVAVAKTNVAAAGLSDRISLVCASIHDYSPPNEVGKQFFDAVYFSGSFMIIPNKADALRRCRNFLTSSGGKFYFTQSFEHRGLVGSVVNYAVKPLLKLTTSIDFGSVTYRDEFEATLKEANVKVQLFEVMSAGSFRDEVLVVAQ